MNPFRLLLVGWLAAQTPAFAASSDGSLDPSFSGYGLVQTDFGNGLEDQAVAVSVSALPVASSPMKNALVIWTETLRAFR